MKINDRLILGTVCGLLANIPKAIISRIAMQHKLAEINGPEIAAGMFIPPHKLASPSGRFVGWLADFIIAGMLGISTVYMLSLTGKDRYIIKGILAGQAMWQAFYGLLGNFGASQVKAYSPNTVVTEAISHAVYGLVTTVAAIKLGDEKLFTGEIPLST